MLQPTALLLTYRCHINVSHVKNPPACDAAYRQHSVTTSLNFNF